MTCSGLFWRLIAVGAIGGCAVPGPEVVLPDLGLTAADRFATTGAPGSAGDPASSPEASAWWRQFDDPALAEWVERALAANPDIAIARERLLRAQAGLTLAGAARYPLVSGQIGTVADAGSTLAGSASERQPRAVIGADWAPDLWGARRQAERSAAATVLRERDLVRGTRLAIAATTARAVIEWREAVADLALLASFEAVQRDALRVVQARVDAGLSPKLDASRAMAEISATRAEAAVARIRARQANHALQFLAGDRVATPALAGESAAIPALAGGLPAALPIDLMRLRPDLLAAEHAALAAAADVGIARAELLPTLQLRGTLALASGAAVFDRVNASISALLDMVLFDGGARRARIRISESLLREALDIYRRTLLDALRQVEDAWVARTGVSAQIRELNDSLKAADTAVEQARALYTAGLNGFLDVLDARRTALRQRRELARANANAARQDVAIFEAMGIMPLDDERTAVIDARAARTDGL
ncbi:MAG: efflux transporter outer membrane subunit [Burkholderiaceae bacterium]